MKTFAYLPEDTEPKLELRERQPEEPEPDEVRVRVAVSGVNPTDWKHAPGGLITTEQLRAGSDPVVPNHDGAGTVDKVGSAVTTLDVGDRVWIHLARKERPTGTAQEQTVVPATRAVRLPDSVSFEIGATLGVPAMTAHRLLTVGGGVEHLRPGSLAGRTVLVAGGAGAVGHAAIQLAVWSGARVLTTVSSPQKAVLAEAAGAHQVFNYRDEDIEHQILAGAPDGVDHVIEVSPASNLALDLALLKNSGSIAYYADDGGGSFEVPVLEAITKNVGLHAVLLATVGDFALRAAAEDITSALKDGALPVGEDAGLPIAWYGLEATAQALSAVKAGAVGKVLIAVDPQLRHL